MTKWIILIIGILGSVQISAQSIETEVRAMFKDASKVQWIEHYRGRLSDINDVAMTLGYDGSTYKGVLWYLRSGTKFHVKGTINNDSLLLTEYDSAGLATGLIEGRLEEYEGFTGNWFTLDKNLGESLELMPSAGEPRFAGYCGDNKWVHKYIGALGDEQVEMILRRGNNGYIKGTVFFENDNKTYYAEGELLNHEREIFLEIKDVNWNEKAIIEAKIDFSSYQISGKVILQGLEKSCDLPLKEKLSVGCMEYADFSTKSEVTFPKTSNEDFNENIETQVQNWLTTSQTYTKKFQGSQGAFTAAQRLSLRSYCWYEIEYFNDSFISGKIIHTNSWDSDYQGFAFNYSLTDNQPITLDSLFKEGFDYQSFTNDYIESEIKKRPFYGDGYFEVWIESQQFKYFNFRREGLVFSTNFNGIYGEQQVTIPYEKIKEHLRDSSMLELIE